MNQLHGRFAITNDDFLYVLSSFIYEPIRWNARFGWRPMCEPERLGYFYFWREVGRRMNIRDIPADYDTFERFNREYEQRHYRFTESSRRVGTATRELFVSWFPAVLAPVVRSVIHALLDDPLLEAFGFPRPSRAMRWLVAAGLRDARSPGALPAAAAAAASPHRDATSNVPRRVRDRAAGTPWRPSSMRRAMRTSVVVPVYNSERTLRRAGRPAAAACWSRRRAPSS